MRPYQDTELRLHGGLDTSLVRALQRDLRALGYLGGGIDGVFGGGTEKAVRSLQWDLLNHVRDTDAPLAIKDYAGGRVTTVTGVVDSGLAACIDDMTGDANFVKVPSSSTPAAENQRAADAIRAMGRMDVPKPFLLAILGQESNWRHFAVPAGSDEDNFVTLGLDRNGKHGPDQITSRGYGIGQYTFDYHPLPQDKMRDFVLDPVKNVQHAIDELLEKYNDYVIGPKSGTQATDRIVEVDGLGAKTFKKLRPCQYDSGDAKYMSDCRMCMHDAGTCTIKSGDPVYAGSDLKYEPTQYYKDPRYYDVPIRRDVPCDWPYAARRYNGSGVNSYHYQTKILQRVLRGQ